jgi:L-idonate 5-dehydrogenase
METGYTLQGMSSDTKVLRGNYRAFAIRAKEDGALIDLPLRPPTENEIRVKVAYVGICGSDLHYYFEGANGSFVINEPLIPGHEVSGTVDLDPLGEFANGVPVAIFPAQGGQELPGLEGRPHLWSGVRYLGSAATKPHTQGALSEYIYVQRNMIRTLPKNVPLKLGALAEPLSVALHGVRLAGELSGKSVLISGAGPIGLLTVVAAKSAGADQITITDLFDQALERSKQVGADHVINVRDNSLNPDTYDVVIECSGSAKAVNAALKAVQRGGVVVQVGMIGASSDQIDIGLVVTKELRVLGAFRFNNEMDEAIRLLERHGELASTITAEFPLAEIIAAFELARDAQRSGKVVVAL